MALFQERTGLNDPFNFNNDIQPVDFNYYQDFLDKPEVRKSIHVGNLTYHNVSMDAYKHLFMDFAFSVADKVAVLLDNDYKMMIYNGQVHASDILRENNGRQVSAQFPASLILSWSVVTGHGSLQQWTC